MKPDPAPSPTVSPSDWEALRLSRPEDYDGHTGFDRMTPAARLAWLDAAVEFVWEQSKRRSARETSKPSLQTTADSGEKTEEKS